MITIGPPVPMGVRNQHQLIRAYTRVVNYSSTVLELDFFFQYSIIATRNAPNRKYSYSKPTTRSTRNAFLLGEKWRDSVPKAPEIFRFADLSLRRLRKCFKFFPLVTSYKWFKVHQCFLLFIFLGQMQWNKGAKTTLEPLSGWGACFLGPSKHDKNSSKITRTN